MCFNLKDFEELRAQLLLLGGKVDLSVWGEKETFATIIGLAAEDELRQQNTGR